MKASSVVTLFALLVCTSPGLAQSSPQLSFDVLKSLLDRAATPGDRFTSPKSPVTNHRLWFTMLRVPDASALLIRVCCRLRLHECRSSGP